MSLTALRFLRAPLVCAAAIGPLPGPAAPVLLPLAPALVPASAPASATILPPAMPGLIPAQSHGGETGGGLDREGPSAEDIRDFVDAFGEHERVANPGQRVIDRDRALQETVRRAAAAVGIEYAQAVTLLTTSAQVSPLATRLFAAVVDESDEECERLPGAYRIDCVRQGFDALAEALPKRGDYAAVRVALDETSRQLARIAREERARGQPRVRAQGGTRGYVATGGGAAASQRAANAVLIAREQLLRSVPEGDPRHVHMQRIAAAFDGTAVLLRS
jgi:hypothetical protein